MSGGQEAIEGFKRQVLAALLDGSAKQDWDTVTVEPKSWSSTGACEKVDILWKLSSGAQRHDQVKGSVNVIRQSECKKWATELSNDSTATQKRLIIIGQISAADESRRYDHGDVVVETWSVDNDILLTAIANNLDRMAGEHFPATNSVQRVEIARKLSGLVLFESSGGREWSRSELGSEVLATARAVLQPAPPDRRLQISLTITIEISENGDTDEYWVFDIKNTSNDIIPLSNAVQITITDCPSCRLCAITDGLWEDPPIKGKVMDAGQMRWIISVPIRGQVAPNRSRQVGAHLKLSKRADTSGEVWTMSEPYFPSETPQETVVHLIWPRPGRPENQPTAVPSRTFSATFDTYAGAAWVAIRWKPEPNPQGIASGLPRLLADAYSVFYEL